jgi:hypothetical protein
LERRESGFATDHSKVRIREEDKGNEPKAEQVIWRGKLLPGRIK